MTVFVLPSPFWVLAKLNQRGIDKDYGPTGQSGCAEESGLALEHIYLGTVAYAGTQRPTQTDAARKADLHIANKESDSKPPS